MSRRTMTFRAWLLTPVIVLVAPVIASQQAKPVRGARVAVVAIHDSRLLTLCPVVGKNVIVSDVWQSGMEGKFALGRSREGVQSITGQFTNQAVARLFLPVPPSGAPGGSVAPAAPGVLELERLARDVEVQSRVEQQFRKLKTYAVVESVADADFVFLVESNYVPLAASLIQLPPGSRTASRSAKDTPERIFADSDNEWARRQWGYEDQPHPPDPPAGASALGGSFSGVFARGGDRHAGWRDSALAIVIPAGVYLQHAGNGAALTAARLWQGVAPTEHVKRRWEDVSAAQREAAGWKGMSTREREKGPGGSNVKAASPEALVDQFHSKGTGLPDYLPVCAATTGTIRSIGDLAARPSDGPQEAPIPAGPVLVPGAVPGRFRSNITLVTVPVTVTDSDGRSVVDLQASAFHVFEDGLEQKLDRVDPGTSPSHVALLVDTSSGMRLASEGIGATALSLVDALRPLDRAMVVSFDNRIRVLSEFTSDRTELQRAIAQSRPRGGTRLYDALALAVVDRLNAVETRKAIVLFTDGVDTGSQLTNAAGALAAIDTSNVSVYVIRYDTSDVVAPVYRGPAGRGWLVAPDDTQKSAEARSAADQFLGRLAAGTGGRMYFARANANVREMLAQISQELSRQYLLCYYPINDKLDGTYREIRVTVDRPGATVRARNGYRAGALQAGR